MTNTKQTEQTTKSPWLMKYLAGPLYRDLAALQTARGKE